MNVANAVSSRTSKRIATAVMAATVALSATACDDRDTDRAVAAGCALAPDVAEILVVALSRHPLTITGALVVGYFGNYLDETCKEWFGSRSEKPITAPDIANAPVRSKPTSGDLVRLPIVQPAGTKRCPDSVDGLTVYARNGTPSPGDRDTSCAFAVNVANSVGHRNSPFVPVVYSPVMKQWYSMSCAGQYPVVCTGGINAVVYVAR